MKRTSGVVILVGLALLLAGCVERTLTITSTPPGALVTVNSREVGRTPVTVPFTWYGDYAIQLRLDEADQHYQTLKTHYNVTPPAYEIPPFDLLSEMTPWTYHVEKNASFTLFKAQPVTDDQLLQQSEKMRERNLEVPAK